MARTGPGGENSLSRPPDCYRLARQRLGECQRICFSATASLGAGIVLLGVGALTIRKAGSRAALPYAAIPAIFGLQQLVEGSLWLSLPGQCSSSHGLTLAYLLFSNIVWPAYLPLAVWLIEPAAARRRAMLAPLLAGAGVSLFFAYHLAANPVSAALEGAHIRYDLPHPFPNTAFAFYALATCLTPLLSSHRMVRLFGALLIASMMLAYAIYTLWFASVWCYFAALLSLVVWLQVSARSKVRG